MHPISKSFIIPSSHLPNHPHSLSSIQPLLSVQVQAFIRLSSQQSIPQIIYPFSLLYPKFNQAIRPDSHLSNKTSIYLVINHPSNRSIQPFVPPSGHSSNIPCVIHQSNQQSIKPSVHPTRHLSS